MSPKLLKHPTAWIPIALSLAMLAFIFVMIAIHGIPTPDPNADEGVGAHIFQLWLVLEMVMILIFAIKWVPENPKQACMILAIQIFGVLVGCFPVFYFKL